MIKMTEIERQDCVRRFVEQELFACQSMLIEEAFRKNFFSWEDVINLYRPYEEYFLTDADFCRSCGEIAGGLDRETDECRSCYEENREAQDIYEWWLVSDWLEQKLKEKVNRSLTTNTATGGVEPAPDRLFIWMGS